MMRVKFDARLQKLLNHGAATLVTPTLRERTARLQRVPESVAPRHVDCMHICAMSQERCRRPHARSCRRKHQGSTAIRIGSVDVSAMPKEVLHGRRIASLGCHMQGRSIPIDQRIHAHSTEGHELLDDRNVVCPKCRHREIRDRTVGMPQEQVEEIRVISEHRG